LPALTQILPGPWNGVFLAIYAIKTPAAASCAIAALPSPDRRDSARRVQFER
jgi:hypothetical protein